MCVYMLYKSRHHKLCKKYKKNNNKSFLGGAKIVEEGKTFYSLIRKLLQIYIDVRVVWIVYLLNGNGFANDRKWFNFIYQFSSMNTSVPFENCFLMFSANFFAISASPPSLFSFATVHYAPPWIILPLCFADCFAINLFIRGFEHKS